MQLSEMRLSFDALRNASAGSIVYPPGGRFGPRKQRNIQLVLLYTGEMHVSIDGRELDVQPGHIVLLKPGHEETFTFSRTEETWHRWIDVHVTDMDSLIRESLYRMPEVLPLTEEMNRLADLMLNLQMQAASNDPVMLSLGYTALQLYPIESRRASLRREKHPAVYAALSWIHDHYADEIGLKSIAAHAGVSSEHLVRLFKQFEQTTPIHYVWQYRIDRAVQLLRNTGLNVTEIAQRCGFKTSHHLARRLKQSTGRTASQIRRLSWSGQASVVRD